MIKKFLLFLVLALPLAVARAAPLIRVGASDFPPYTIEKGVTISKGKKVGKCQIDPGTYYGIDMDFIGEVLTRAELPYKIEYYSWSRAKELLLNRELTALPGTLYDAQHAANLKYVLYDSGGATIVLRKKGSGVVAKKPEDLKKLRVGTVRDDNYGSSFDEAKKRAEVVVDPAYATLTDDENLRNLAEGKVDVAVINNIVGPFLLQSLKLKKVLEVAPLKFPYGQGERNSGIYIAFNSGVEESLIEKVRSVIATMKKENRLQCIRQRYGISSNE